MRNLAVLIICTSMERTSKFIACEYQWISGVRAFENKSGISSIVFFFQSDFIKIIINPYDLDVGCCKKRNRYGNEVIHRCRFISGKGSAGRQH